MTLDAALLAPETRQAIRLVAAADWSRETYMAGSSALAAHLGHRPARDLDLMSQTNRLRSPDRRDVLEQILRADPGAAVETARDGFLYLRLPSEVAIRVYYYPYPLVDPLAELDGLEVASLTDLGLMKVGAVISRGTRRDFVDLYCLCRRLPLAELLRRSAEKFGHVRDFPLQALKGLADLAQVEGEPMPRLALDLEWAEIETWVRDEVRRLGRIGIGLEPAADPGGS